MPTCVRLHRCIWGYEHTKHTQTHLRANFLLIYYKQTVPKKKKKYFYSNIWLKMTLTSLHPYVCMYAYTYLLNVVFFYCSSTRIDGQLGYLNEHMFKYI